MRKKTTAIMVSAASAIFAFACGASISGVATYGNCKENPPTQADMYTLTEGLFSYEDGDRVLFDPYPSYQASTKIAYHYQNHGWSEAFEGYAVCEIKWKAVYCRWELTHLAKAYEEI